MFPCISWEDVNILFSTREENLQFLDFSWQHFLYKFIIFHTRFRYIPILFTWCWLDFCFPMQERILLVLHCLFMTRCGLLINLNWCTECEFKFDKAYVYGSSRGTCFVPYSFQSLGTMIVIIFISIKENVMTKRLCFGHHAIITIRGLT